MQTKRRVVRILVLLVLVAGLPGFVRVDAARPGEDPSVKSGKHLFILSGQSNMRSPLPETFEGVVFKVFGKDNVVVATYAQPSQPIKQWYKKWTPPEGVNYQPKAGETNGILYDRLMDVVRKKAGNQEFSTVTFVWMQGEADGQAGWGAVYEKSFLGIVDQLKADLKRENINFVLGRINDYRPNGKPTSGRDVVREAQVKLGTENANGAWVDTDDLNTGIDPWSGYGMDGEHFPNPGYRVMGQRFARAACKLIDPKIKFDEGIFDAFFFNTVDEIATHAAIGKKISGTTPDASHAGLAALTDGKYCGNDPDSKGWVAFAPSQKTVEIVIDLGEPQKMKAIAINFLINNKAEVTFPVKADYATSTDGKTYEAVPTFRGGGFRFHVNRGPRQLTKPQALLVLAELDRADVRYVKVTFELGNSWLFLDEIVVNPQPKPQTSK